jgi:hypothetical protein
MRIKNYFLLFPIALGVIISGCEKNEKLKEDETEPEEVRKISRIDEFNAEQQKVESVAFTYDAQGRIEEIAIDYLYAESPDWEWKERYSYPDAGTLVITYFGDTNYDGIINSDDNYVETASLNESGYMVSLKGNVTDRESKFTYTDGYLTKTQTINKETEKYYKYIAYEWQDGCLASWQNRDTDGQKGDLYTYTYGSKIQNKPCSIDLLWLITEEIIQPSNLLGKNSQYLPDAGAFRDEKGVYDDVTTTYRYERDDNGYVTKIFKKTEGDDTERLKYQLTYLAAE